MTTRRSAPRRRPRPPAGGSGLRAALAGYFENLIGQHQAAVAEAAETYPCPWPEQLAAVRAGEPITLHGWQVLSAARAAGGEPPKVDSRSRYRLDGRGLLAREPWAPVADVF